MSPHLHLNLVPESIEACATAAVRHRDITKKRGGKAGGCESASEVLFYEKKREKKKGTVSPHLHLSLVPENIEV